MHRIPVAILNSLGPVLVLFAVANREFVTLSFDQFNGCPALSSGCRCSMLLIMPCRWESWPGASPPGCASGIGGAAPPQRALRQLRQAPARRPGLPASPAADLSGNCIDLARTRLNLPSF